MTFSEVWRTGVVAAIVCAMLSLPAHAAESPETAWLEEAELLQRWLARPFYGLEHDADLLQAPYELQDAHFASVAMAQIALLEVKDVLKTVFAAVADGDHESVRASLNPGSLPAPLANSFRGDSYTANTVSEATTLYRVSGGTAGQIGGYWTRTHPAGPVQSIIESALNPRWGNTATNVVTIRVPAGTMIYEVAAAAKGGLVGGGSQVFIPNVNPSWLVP